MERGALAVMRIVWPAFAPGRVAVDGDAVQHARVRRTQRGDAVELLDGAGRVGVGRVDDVGKHRMEVVVDRVETRPRLADLEVIVPVADRDRMLLAAEKCAELQVTMWRPVVFHRSRSVSPRGEGPKFRERVLARMRAAVEQSGAAWLPTVAEEASFEDVVGASRAGWSRLLLDVHGEPLTTSVGNTASGIVLMAGPEGGLEESERGTAIEAGWKPVAVSAATLRFETAVICGAAIARALQLGHHVR